MNKKKIVMFLVEGPSDESAIGTIMKEYFSKDEVRFVVVHGDITTSNYVNTNNIVKKINEKVNELKKKYHYKTTDYEQIIHIVDTDGVFISPDCIQENGSGNSNKKTLYFEDHIESPHPDQIMKRNSKKSNILFLLSRLTSINKIPYRIYFNSCNLEHVLYHELREFSDEEKQILSDEFAEKYEDHVEEFISFISDFQLKAPGTYNETWKFIQKENRSLQRFSNMHLIFENN